MPELTVPQPVVDFGVFAPVPSELQVQRALERRFVPLSVSRALPVPLVLLLPVFLGP